MAGLERDEGATQHGEIAVEVEIFGERGVLPKQGVAHPVVTNFAASPVAAHQSSEAGGRLGNEAAEIVITGVSPLI